MSKHVLGVGEVVLAAHAADNPGSQADSLHQLVQQFKGRGKPAPSGLVSPSQPSQIVKWHRPHRHMVPRGTRGQVPVEAEG